MPRLLIGALVAGILVFFWGYVSHEVLPLKQDVYQRLPDEDAVVRALSSTVAHSGTYFYPGMDVSREPTPEEAAAFKVKYEAGPRGLIVFDTKDKTFMSPKTFGIEFASNVLAALLAAFVLASSSAGFLGRVLIVTFMGLFAWLSISVSYWNWDGFSDAFTTLEAVDQLGGWFLGGIALAAIVKPRRAAYE